MVWNILPNVCILRLHLRIEIVLDLGKEVYSKFKPELVSPNMQKQNSDEIFLKKLLLKVNKQDGFGQFPKNYSN